MDRTAQERDALVEQLANIVQVQIKPLSLPRYTIERQVRNSLDILEAAGFVLVERDHYQQLEDYAAGFTIGAAIVNGMVEGRS